MGLTQPGQEHPPPAETLPPGLQSRLCQMQAAALLGEAALRPERLPCWPAEIRSLPVNPCPGKVLVVACIMAQWLSWTMMSG